MKIYNKKIVIVAILLPFLILLALITIFSEHIYQQLQPSGGGSVHSPPKSVVAGIPLDMFIEVSVWGGGNDDITTRYKAMRCIYKIGSSDEWNIIWMNLINKGYKTGLYKCTIPLYHVKEDTPIHYYFEGQFDGRYFRRDGETIFPKNRKKIESRFKCYDGS